MNRLLDESLDKSLDKAEGHLKVNAGYNRVEHRAILSSARYVKLICIHRDWIEAEQACNSMVFITNHGVCMILPHLYVTYRECHGQVTPAGSIQLDYKI